MSSKTVAFVTIAKPEAAEVQAVSSLCSEIMRMRIVSVLSLVNGTV